MNSCLPTHPGFTCWISSGSRKLLHSLLQTGMILLLTIGVGENLTTRSVFAGTELDALSAQSPANIPLRTRIDQFIEFDLSGSNGSGPVAPIASDAEFLRRVYLDLTGTIPTPDEAKAFLSHTESNKRELLVDRLLGSHHYAIQMANVFDVMLMERRPDKHVTTPEWQKYLQESFRANKPFDQLAREILNADGTDATTRPAAKFFLDREAEPNLMTRDIGRLFFGVDLQCAQCHDHPLVDHYLQSDYYGIYAFVSRTVLFTDAAQKKSFLGEKAEGDASFKSVFTQETGTVRPQLFGGQEIDELRYRQGEEYVAIPSATVRPIPKYSRRAKLAELATNGFSHQFNLNIANRIWGLLMGQGLVHPLDLHHPANSPTHPDVLELIANEFVSSRYDLRSLLKELVLTQTYQRSIDAPSSLSADLALAMEKRKALESRRERLKQIAEQSRERVEKLREELKTLRKSLEPAEAAWKTAEQAVTTAKKPADDAMAALTKSQSESTAKQTALGAVNEASAKSAEAAKLLPNDKDLANVVATYTSKVQQLTTEIAALQKTIADQTAAHQALLPKLNETQVAADAAFAQFAEARKPIDLARANLIDAWNKHKSDFETLTIAKRQSDQWQLHVVHAEALARSTQAMTSIENSKSQLASAVQSVQKQQTVVNQQQEMAASTESAMSDAVKVLDESKAQLSAKQAVVSAVAEAVVKTEAVLQKLPGDAELTAAVQTLKARSESLTKEATSLEQTMNERAIVVRDISQKVTQAKDELKAAEAELNKRNEDVTASTNVVNDSIKRADEAGAQVSAATSSLVDSWTSQSAIRPLKGLSAEQMARSVMQATGVVDGIRTSADAEIEKTITKASVVGDAQKSTDREFKVEQQLNEMMRGDVNAFISVYGSSPGQSQEVFFATSDQALFAANGSSIVGWATGGTLNQRLQALADPKDVAKELYIGVLSRYPTEAEIAEVADQWTKRTTEKPAAARDLIWALITSAEFRFNH